MPAAVRGAPCGGAPRRRIGVVVAGFVLVFLVEAHADVALQRSRCQPLLGQAALEEGDARAEVGQTVHPARDLTPTQQL